MHVLFVDDTPDTIEPLCLGFTHAGHQVKTASDAFEALRVIARNADTLDVIILDYHMPNMSGMEAVQQLQQIKKFASIPVILFTGDKSGVIEDRARKLGIARVVYKPMAFEELIALAQQVVNGS